MLLKHKDFYTSPPNSDLLTSEYLFLIIKETLFLFSFFFWSRLPNYLPRFFLGAFLKVIMKSNPATPEENVTSVSSKALVFCIRGVQVVPSWVPF